MQIMQKDVLRLLKLLAPKKCNLDFTRVGRIGDGGYVIPSDFYDTSQAVVSLGIGDDCSFDLDCANKGLPVYQFDPSITESPYKHPRFMFFKEAFGSYENSSGLTLDEIFLRVDPQLNSIMVKSDVESGEWSGIQRTSHSALSKVSIFVAELHSFANIANPAVYKIFLSVLEKLAEHFVVSLITPNDAVGIKAIICGIPIPDCLEVTFISKKIYGKKITTENLVELHSLQTPSASHMSKILWNPSWYLLGIDESI